MEKVLFTSIKLLHNCKKEFSAEVQQAHQQTKKDRELSNKKNTFFMTLKLRFSKALFACLLMVCSTLWSGTLFAQGEVNMPSTSGEVTKKEVTSTIKFYDQAGPHASPTYSQARWVISAIQFKPAQKGGKVTVSIKSITSIEQNDCKLHIYNGAVSLGYEEDPWDPYAEGQATLPSGAKPVKSFSSTGGEFPYSFTSTAEDGAITVVFEGKHYGDDYGSFDFEGEASVAQEGPMVYKSAEVKPATNSLPLGMQQATLLNINITTDGSNSPLSLSKLSISGLNNANLKNIKLVDSKKATHNFNVSSGTFDAIPLSSGFNNFRIVGDVAANATAGSQIVLTLNALTLSNGEQTVTSNNSTTHTLSNEVNMSAQSTYIVGSELHFYDDGGKAGKITEGFKGSVTFIPAKKGEKIQISFTKLELFNTNPSKNDILNVYNGTTADKAKLLKTFLKETGVVISTSEDGALTVTLTSTTGIPKNGFEATVKSIVPTPMEFGDVALEQLPAASTTQLSAVSNKQKVALLNVNTINSKDPLQLKTVELAISGNVISQIQLFADDKTTEPLATANVTDGKAILTLSTSKTLNMGSNSFVVAASCHNDARNGAAYGVQLTKVTADGGKVKEASKGSAKINNTINNTVYATIGTQNVEVYSAWTVASQPKVGNSYSYDATSGNRIITFKANAEGQVLKLDLTTFDIYYSYHPHPTFVVYDGATTSGKELWKMTRDTKNVGPGKAIVSSSQYLTIQVTFPGSGSGKGFKGTVTPILPLNGVTEVTQAPTDSKSISLFDEETPVITATVSKISNPKPLKLKSVEFTFSGDATTLKDYKLYAQNGSQDATLLAGTASNKDGVITITLNTPYTIAEGDTHFTLNVCPSGKGDLKSKVAFAFSKLICENNINFAVEAPSQTKEYTFSAEVCQPTQKGIHTFTFKEGQGISYTDDGGSASNMQKDAYESTYVFKPAKKGEVVRFDIEKFDIGYTAIFSLYKGTEVNEKNLIVQTSRSQSKLSGAYWSDLEHDGALTVHFTKKQSSYSQSPGWVIKASSIVPTSRKLVYEADTAYNHNKVMVGSSNISVAQISFTIEGIKDAATLPTVQIKAAQIEKAYLCLGGASETFSVNMEKVAGVKDANGVFTFTPTQTYSGNGKYYLYVSVNIPTTLKANDKVDVELLKVGEQAISNVKATLTIAEGLKGEYTIGNSDAANYKTLAEVNKALKDGISGPVTFLFEDGTYTAPLNIDSVPGASKENSITFKSKSGKAQNVTIENDPKGSSSGYRDPEGMVYVSKTSHVTFENITLKMTKKIFQNLLHVSNASSFFTLRGCVLTMPNNVGADYKNNVTGVKITGGKADNLETNDVLIENCQFTDGYIGLEFSGPSAIKYEDAKRMTVKNCTFTNQASKSIYVSSNIHNLLIENNNISNNIVEMKNKGNLWAIDVVLCGKGERIINNRIYIQGNNYGSAIYLRRTYDVVYNEESWVANNSIVIDKPVALGKTGTRTASVIGINANFDRDPQVDGLRIYNNTIRMIKDSTSNAVLYPMDLYVSEKAVIRNNILQNPDGKYLIRLFKNTTFVADHNAYYAKSEKPFIIDGKDSLSMEAYVAKVGEKESKTLLAKFISNESTQIKNLKEFCFGAPIPGLTTDIVGTERNAQHPTVGCYEFIADSEYPLELKEVSVVAESTSAKVTFTPTRNSSLFYKAVAEGNEAPAKDVILQGKPFACALNTQETLVVEELQANTAYTLYGVLKANTEDKSTEVFEIAKFKTKFLPTATATFDDVKNYQAGKAFEDGTMKFEGFTVAKEKENGVATTAATQSTITLTNTDEGIALEAMQMRGQGKVTLATDKGKSIEAIAENNEFITVALKPLGNFKTLTITTEEGKHISIDNVGFSPRDPQLANIDPLVVDANNHATLKLRVDSAAAPYSIVISGLEKEITLKNLWSYNVTEQLTASAYADCDVTLTDALGRTVNGSFIISNKPLDGKIGVVTFEDVEMDKDQDHRILLSYFSQGLYFPIDYNKKWKSWSGFAVSRSTATDFQNYAVSQYNVPSGKGANNSKAFAVVFPFGKAAMFQTMEGLVAQPIRGMYVSITSYTLNSVEKGDTYSGGAFKEGDFYIMELTADNGKKVEIPLADFRNGKQEVVKEWTWVDLSSLGDVTSVTFKAVGSRNNEWGLLTPGYIAIDDVNAANPTNTNKVIAAQPVDMWFAANTLHINNAEGVQVNIYNLNGELVYSVIPTSNSFEVYVELQPGQYIARAAATTRKLIIR